MHDEEYLQWLSVHHPNAIPSDPSPGLPEALEVPSDLFDFGTIILCDPLSFTDNSTLENCLLHLDHMLACGTETAFLEDRDRDTDH